MRLATIINLLLFTSAACALQVQHEERRDGFQSSDLPHRAFQPVSRRRLASRGIRRTSDIAVRELGQPHFVAPAPGDILAHWKHVKLTDHNGVTMMWHDERDHVTVYKVTSPLSYHGMTVVIKEITILWFDMFRGVLDVMQMHSVGSGELRTGACRASWEGGRTLHDVLGDATARQCNVPHSQLPNCECTKGADGGAKDDDELAGSSSQLARVWGMDARRVQKQDALTAST